MKVDLNGQVALVTGAARNIGRAIADALADNGARVIYTDISAGEASAAAAAKPNAIGMAMDVTEEDNVNRVVERVVADHGGIDILVNNAGVNTGQRLPIDRFPRAEWDKIVDVDLTGLYLVSKAAAAAMRPRKYGRIVNISSVVGLVPLRLQCAYAAAKGGVAVLTKAMAIELGADGILVNCVAPGSTLTDGTRSLFYNQQDKQQQERAQSMIAHIPLGRPGEQSEIAHAVLFFAARESSYITGQVLSVDGGWTAGYTREF
jgi:3-oxoacyl-[acyl-carrier protein] reductase